METLSYPKDTKARKNHRCNFCGERINKGETYIYSSYAADGEVYSWKTHRNCDYIAKTLRMYEQCDGSVSESDFCDIINDKYYDLINTSIPAKLGLEYDFSVILGQIHKVIFVEKLKYVIRYYKKLYNK